MIIILVIIRSYDDHTIQHVLISVCALMALMHLKMPYVDKQKIEGIILQN